VWAEAEALCRPLQVLGTGTRSAGCCETHPFQMHIEGGAHIEIAAFKPAESGSGRILRLVEVHGGAGDIELAWSQPPGRVRAVDLHESDADRVEVVHQGCTTRMGIRPFQILTLRIEGDDTP
jgi:alpha-mannosidase